MVSKRSQHFPMPFPCRAWTKLMLREVLAATCISGEVAPRSAHGGSPLAATLATMSHAMIQNNNFGTSGMTSKQIPAPLAAEAAAHVL